MFTIKFSALCTIAIAGLLTISCKDKDREQIEAAPLPAKSVNVARSANLIFEETVEGPTPFSTAYDAGSDLAASYSLTYVTAPVFQGLKSARFELRDTDPEVSSGKRAEVTIVKGTITKDTWYSFAAYFPSDDFAMDTTQEIINQWYQSGSPATALRINKDRFYLLTGNSLKPDNRQIIDLAAVTKDVWHEFVFHFIHSYQSDGLIEVWLNGTKLLTHTGGNMYNDVLPKWKLGVYKSSFSGTNSLVHKRVLYYDNIRCGNSNASYQEMAPSTIPDPTPALILPANSATGVSITPTLTWDYSTGATAYDVQVSTVSDFSSTVFTQTGITGTNIPVTGLLNSTVYYWRVDAVTPTGTTGFSPVRSFTTTAPLPPPIAPTLSSPADRATGVSTSPTLSWNASSGATSYHAQVSTVSDFSTLVFDKSGITTTNIQVTGLTNSTVYFWRVNAANANGEGSYSTARSFTTTAPPPPPNPPTLSSPANGATGISTSPTLSWNTSSGATSYEVQVSTASDFLSTVFDQIGISGTNVTVTGLSNSTTYYWRVNATNSIGTSAYSTARSFTTAAPPPPPNAPTLSSPTNGATGISITPTLSWNTSSGATSYRAQVSTASDFSALIFDQSNITGTNIQITGLSNSTIYYWRVNATNSIGTSGYSTVRSFTTIAPPSAPPVPTLKSPANLATGISTSPTLSWNASTGATSYDVQVSTASDFSSAPIVFSRSNLTTTNIQVTPALSGNTTYYWRVDAVNANGTSSFSSARSFTTAAPPSAPTLNSPADGATGVGVSPTLRWNASTGATSYSVQVSTAPDFSTTAFTKSGINSTNTKVTGLSKGTLYYWRVNAVNAVGTGAWSTVRSFTP